MATVPVRTHTTSKVFIVAVLLTMLALPAYGLLLAVGANAAAKPAETTGKVTMVSDGDTITVQTAAGTRVRIRLAEIDAPETAQSFGAKSKQSLAAVCLGKKATFTRDTIDRYKRVVSKVKCNGVDAQAHQLRTGMAWVYDQYVKDKSLYPLQSAARKARAGLWSDPAPVAPWEFRRQQREAHKPK